MSTIRKFIIVDDDDFNNLLCRMALETALGEADITEFTDPEEALAFLQENYMAGVGPTILLLDLNMPTLTGWEFMEKYNQFSNTIKNQVSIYILSSSVDHRDTDKAKANKYIKGFISKPLSNESIAAITGA